MHRTSNVQVTLYIHITLFANKFFLRILIQVQSFIKCINRVIQGSSSNSDFSTIKKDLVIVMRSKYQIMQQKNNSPQISISNVKKKLLYLMQTLGPNTNFALPSPNPLALPTTNSQYSVFGLELSTRDKK